MGNNKISVKLFLCVFVCVLFIYKAKVSDIAKRWVQYGLERNAGNLKYVCLKKNGQTIFLAFLQLFCLIDFLLAFLITNFSYNFVSSILAEFRMSSLLPEPSPYHSNNYNYGDSDSDAESDATYRPTIIIMGQKRYLFEN